MNCAVWLSQVSQLSSASKQPKPPNKTSCFCSFGFDLTQKMWLNLYWKEIRESALLCFKTSKYAYEMRLPYSIILNTRIFKVIWYWIWSYVFYTPLETGWFDPHVENLQRFHLMILRQGIFPVCGWDFQNQWNFFFYI